MKYLLHWMSEKLKSLNLLCAADFCSWFSFCNIRSTRNSSFPNPHTQHGVCCWFFILWQKGWKKEAEGKKKRCKVQKKKKFSSSNKFCLIKWMVITSCKKWYIYVSGNKSILNFEFLIFKKCFGLVIWLFNKCVFNNKSTFLSKESWSTYKIVIKINISVRNKLC